MNADRLKDLRHEGADDLWRAFHLFYHGPLALVLQSFVQPVVGRLLAAGLIDSFFFIRYPLGGPHVRLRIRPCAGCAHEAVQRLADAAAVFLARQPSTRSLDPELIRQQNRSILAAAPEESDDTVYPDNTFLPFTFSPETERYGGPELLVSSLEFFALSSARSLSLVTAHINDPWSRQLAAISRLLALQAWGLARDAEDLTTLLASRACLTAEADPLLRRADEVFNCRRETFCALLRQTLAAVVHDAEAPWFGQAARQLGNRLRAVDVGVQQKIELSQMHMTANRLGLKPSEEIYLGRILWRSAQELAVADRSFWDELCNTLKPGEDHGMLQDLFPVAFHEAFPASSPQATSTDGACSGTGLA